VAVDIKQFTTSLIIVLLFITCAFGQQRFEAPIFIDGNFWQFRVLEHGEYMKTERELNGIYEIGYSNGRFKAFKLEANQETKPISEPGVLLGLVGQTALQHIQFPLFEGKTWITDYTFRPRRREIDRSVRAVTRITDFAEVTISAGSFKTFKLEREARFKNVDHWNFVYCWSPQTKSVVKYEMNVRKGEAAGNKREIELIKFDSAR
jgi:hypothetical protein